MSSRSRWIFRGAVAGLAACGLLLWAWHALWLPFVNVEDPRWQAAHDTGETCTEIDRVVQLWGWTHDATFLVGRCGPDWVERILGDETLLAQDKSHWDDALAELTGRRFGKDAAAWKTWYASNRDKSHDEWYLEAFADAGIDVPEVLGPDDVYPLLSWIGERRHETGPSARATFEFLRGQDAMTTILSDGPTRPLSPIEVMGLRRFTLWDADIHIAEGAIITSPAYRFWPPTILWILTACFAFVAGLTLRCRDTRPPGEPRDFSVPAASPRLAERGDLR